MLPKRMYMGEVRDILAGLGDEVLGAMPPDDTIVSVDTLIDPDDGTYHLMIEVAPDGL